MTPVSQLIRTKLRLPFTRPGLVPRPRLQELFARGLHGPLTLVIAPAGFGKSTLVTACLAGCEIPVAWLSLDKNDNQTGGFLTYLIAALQEADPTVGNEAGQRLSASQQASPEVILTSLINDLDSNGRENVLVLDDYQFISSQAVHEAVIFLLEHCPDTFHLVIATRSDPPLPLARLRARGQTAELRAADLRFSEPEAALFLNDVMGLHLDAGSVAALTERTEGWIAGLQMAALTMRDRADVPGFIEGFSGTNRYILDYLLEEVLASQPSEIQQFLLHTSILERLSASLCEAILGNGDKERRSEEGKRGFGKKELERGRFSPIPYSVSPGSLYQPVLEYLEHANLFLVPLDEERLWYRYHHLFADLLRAQLQKSLGNQGVAQIHLRAAAWHEQNGFILEAIYHASMASDDEMVERLIKQNYLEMMNRGELSWVRFWMGNLSRELVYRRPWLCLYEAMNRSWFGQLEEANLFLQEAEKHIRAEGPAHGAQSMLGYLAYVKSRVTAMQGDTRQAIELCLTARENVPADNLELQIDFSITLGYEYFLYGDFINADKVLNEMIRSASTARAINNPVAAYCLLARMQVYQGRLHEAEDLLQKAAHLIHEAGGQYHGAAGLVEVETAALLCERNELEVALVRLERGLDLLPEWGKADDLCLAYITLGRIQLALGNRIEAVTTTEKAVQLIKTCGVFSEARSEVETAQVKIWLVKGDWSAVDRWSATLEKRFGSRDPFRFEDELAHITQVQVFLAQNRPAEAIRSLARLEETARSNGRQGRLIRIMILNALALQAVGERAQAEVALTESLALAEPGGYVRVFLDEGQPMQRLLVQWRSQEQTRGVATASAGPLRNYAIHLLSQFEAGPHEIPPALGKASPAGDPSTRDDLVEPLTPRELEVLRLLAEGRSNRQVAEKLVLSEGTVKFYVHAVMQKLGVHSRTQAIRIARERNLV